MAGPRNAGIRQRGMAGLLDLDLPFAIDIEVDGRSDVTVLRKRLEFAVRRLAIGLRVGVQVRGQSLQMRGHDK